MQVRNIRTYTKTYNMPGKIRIDITVDYENAKWLEKVGNKSAYVNRLITADVRKLADPKERLRNEVRRLGDKLTEKTKELALLEGRMRIVDSEYFESLKKGADKKINEEDI